MDLNEIKRAVRAGKTVCWSNEGYEVVNDSIGQWLVVFKDNGYATGLQNKLGVLTEDPSKFFIKSS